MTLRHCAFSGMRQDGRLPLVGSVLVRNRAKRQTAPFDKGLGKFP